MNRQQRRAINRIIHYYRRRNEYNGVTSIRLTHKQAWEGSKKVSVDLKTRRSDCEKYSARQVFCEQTLFAFIGPRGGIHVCMARDGTRDEAAHLQKMLRGAA